MSYAVRRHYELYPYPNYPLLASVPLCDTYALNLTALWSMFNGILPSDDALRVLVAGCGSFAPYPFALANPDSRITALDLSQRSLRRARFHCLLHGCSNVSFVAGDLLDPKMADERYGLIDSYGVLHHLDDPLAGLKALETRLIDGGILRIMVYSRYARVQEEAIRRAFRLLQVSDPITAAKLIKRSKPGTSLRRFAEASDEVAFKSGLADALLHPCVHTFRIDGLMELVRQTGLQPLLFGHNGAFYDINQEVDRIRRMEADKQSPGNFILYLGHNVASPSANNAGSLVMLNPCLKDAIGFFKFGTTQIPSRLGRPNQPIGRLERQFLRQFLRPVAWETLSRDSQTESLLYFKSLFLLRYRLNTE